jgi:hypothetical protein
MAAISTIRLVPNAMLTYGVSMASLANVEHALTQFSLFSATGGVGCSKTISSVG